MFCELCFSFILFSCSSNLVRDDFTIETRQISSITDDISIVEQFYVGKFKLVKSSNPNSHIGSVLSRKIVQTSSGTTYLASFDSNNKPLEMSEIFFGDVTIARGNGPFRTKHHWLTKFDSKGNMFSKNVITINGNPIGTNEITKTIDKNPKVIIEKFKQISGSSKEVVTDETYVFEKIK